VLPAAQLGLALLTVGLIRPWGEVFPRWLPALGGRRVAVAFAVGAATAGAVLVGVWLWSAVVMDLLGAQHSPASRSHPGARCRGGRCCAGMRRCCYGPPLLLALTWHYLRRRRGSPHPHPPRRRDPAATMAAVSPGTWDRPAEEGPRWGLRGWSEGRVERSHLRPGPTGVPGRTSSAPGQGSNSRARRNTPSSISSVNFLVLVFCCHN
jgi:hypothetical protein